MPAAVQVDYGQMKYPQMTAMTIYHFLLVLPDPIHYVPPHSASRRFTTKIDSLLLASSDMLSHECHPPLSIQMYKSRSQLKSLLQS